MKERQISLDDAIYLKKALAIACNRDKSLDIPRLNKIVRTLLNVDMGIGK